MYIFGVQFGGPYIKTMGHILPVEYSIPKMVSKVIPCASRHSIISALAYLVPSPRNPSSSINQSSALSRALSCTGKLGFVVQRFESLGFLVVGFPCAESLLP